MSGGNRLVPFATLLFWSSNLPGHRSEFCCPWGYEQAKADADSLLIGGLSHGI